MNLTEKIIQLEKLNFKLMKEIYELRKLIESLKKKPNYINMC